MKCDAGDLAARRMRRGRLEASPPWEPPGAASVSVLARGRNSAIFRKIKGRSHKGPQFCRCTFTPLPLGNSTIHRPYMQYDREKNVFQKIWDAVLGNLVWTLFFVFGLPVLVRICEPLWDLVLEYPYLSLLTYAIAILGGVVFFRKRWGNLKIANPNQPKLIVIAPQFLYRFEWVPFEDLQWKFLPELRSGEQNPYPSRLPVFRVMNTGLFAAVDISSEWSIQADINIRLIGNPEFRIFTPKIKDGLFHLYHKKFGFGCSFDESWSGFLSHFLPPAKSADESIPLITDY